MNRHLKCYISSSSRIDLTPIYKILEKLNVEYHSLYDFSIGKSFSDLIKRKIRESDFVIALVEDKNQNVIYEIGLADGLNKPVFLLVDRETKLPFYLEGMISYQIDWEKNTKLVELSLKNYIEDISHANQKYRKKSTGKNSNNLTINDTNEIIVQLRKLRVSNEEGQLANLITNMFKKINVQAISEISMKDKSSVDIAIMNENLSSYFGNLFLIEIKTGNLTGDKIQKAESQLQNYINKTDSSTGILLYLDKENKRFEYGSKLNPLILRFDIEDFVQGVASEGFEKLMINTRNELFHGKIK